MTDYKKLYEDANKRVATRFGSDVARELFPEFYESEDEKIRKELMDFVVGNTICKDGRREKYLAWLEKQGEQIQAIFKKGDWVACNQELCFESPLCIKDIDNNNYRVESVDGCSGVPTINYLDNYYHLYTIKDVKDGDVLVYEGEIFIIKFYVLWHKIVYHCCYDGKNLHKHSIYDSWRKEDFDKVHPATKEQRELLFTKMKEAGYEWDADKKELKQLSQSKVTKISEQVWSEEDEHRVEDTIYFLETAKKHYASDVELNACIDWLKSLKDRI